MNWTEYLPPNIPDDNPNRHYFSAKRAALANYLNRKVIPRFQELDMTTDEEALLDELLSNTTTWKDLRVLRHYHHILTTCDHD